MEATAEPVKVVLFGLGVYGRKLAKLLYQKPGVEIVGAVGRKNGIGEDIGVLAGLGSPIGIRLSDDVEAVLTEAGAGLAICATEPTMAGAFEQFAACARHGLDVLTLTDEACYPWNCTPEIAASLDALAKENGVTIAPSGVEDLFFVHQAAALTGASFTIDSIEGTSVVDADECGEVVAELVHLGETREQFEKTAGGDQSDALQPFRLALESLAATLGLEEISWLQEISPIYAPSDMESQVLGRTVYEGQVIGTTETATVETAEGIRLVGALITKLFEEGDSECCSWIIRGDPELRLENPLLPGDAATSTTVINRIPHVLAAPAGLLSCDMLPAPRFWRGRA